MPEVPVIYGLKEIPSWAWIIKSGNRSYIFAGTAKDAKIAKDVVSRLACNLGRRVTMKIVVGD